MRSTVRLLGIPLLLGAGFALLSLSGCGGGIARPAGSPSRVTQTRVQRALGLTQRSLALSGVQTQQQALSLNGRTPGESSFSLLGGFMRHIAFVNAGGPHAQSDGDPGWNGEPGFYYDEWLGLWVAVQTTSTAATFLLYEDAEKTRPAGRIVSAFPEPHDTYPQLYRSEYDILAGTLAGSRGFYEQRLESESVGSMRYRDESPAYGIGEGSATWGNGEHAWNSRYEDTTGFWAEASGAFASDGSGTTRSRNSWGYRATFQHHADGSGRGVMEGPDPGLPAIITWDAEGNVRIQWADGTVEEFNWFHPITSDPGAGDGVAAG